MLAYSGLDQKGNKSMATVAPEVRYLLFDVESVADGELISKTRYAGKNYSGDQAILRFRQELLQASGRDFIPYTFQIPVKILIAKLQAALSLI